MASHDQPSVQQHWQRGPAAATATAAAAGRPSEAASEQMDDAGVRSSLNNDLNDPPRPVLLGTY